MRLLDRFNEVTGRIEAWLDAQNMWLLFGACLLIGLILDVPHYYLAHVVGITPGENPAVYWSTEALTFASWWFILFGFVYPALTYFERWWEARKLIKEE